MQKVSDVRALRAAVSRDFQHVASGVVGTPSGVGNQVFVLGQTLFLCVEQA